MPSYQLNLRITGLNTVRYPVIRLDKRPGYTTLTRRFCKLIEIPLEGLRNKVARYTRYQADEIANRTSCEDEPGILI